MAREVGNDARSRKRERDKQNQRQRRRRERDAFEELQRKNELLEQQVKALRGGNHADVQSLSDTVEALEKTNRELKDRLETVDQFVKSWNSLPPRTGARNEYATRILPHNVVGITASQFSSPVGTTPLIASASKVPAPATDYFPALRATSAPSDWSGSVASPVVERVEPSSNEIKVSEMRLQSMLELPTWGRVPANTIATGTSFLPWFDPFSGIAEKLRSIPESFSRCTPCPSPQDLLYGDQTNELANRLSAVTYPNPSRRTEKLAYQWNTYMIARWKIQPTEANFNRIPSMLRPTARQLCIPHAPIFDFIAWPVMRDNMIAAGTKYCRPDVFGLLFVTCRLKATPNADWVIKNENEEPQVDPAFVELFSELDNWVLLDRFWNDYPELVKGMDHKFMISEQDLV